MIIYFSNLENVTKMMMLRNVFVKTQQCFDEGLDPPKYPQKEDVDNVDNVDNIENVDNVDDVDDTFLQHC